MIEISALSGWIAYALIASAATVPLGFRLMNKRRAAPDSKPIGAHATIGICAAAAAGLHTLAILPSLGSPAAVGGGMIAILPGTLAFFLLFAHVGVGMQLRDTKLRDRPKKRRLHLFLASAIGITATAHVILLLRAG
ncbi:MAG: hypothetical protein ABI183_12505 [Polyangiaceae bacterium]